MQSDGLNTYLNPVICKGIAVSKNTPCKSRMKNNMYFQQRNDGGTITEQGYERAPPDQLSLE